MKPRMILLPRFFRIRRLSFIHDGGKAMTSPLASIELSFRRGAIACSTIAILGLTGCITTEESPYPLKNGWRAAKIEEIGPAAKLRQIPPSEDCRIAATQTQRQADRFAVVSYWSIVPLRRSPSDWISRVVPLDTVSSLGVGDSIYVNILDCNVPVAARLD